MESKYFVRKSSGLVRKFGILDLILITTGMIFSLVATTVQFPWFYGFEPGANLAISLLISAIPFVFLMLVYWVIGVSMPRSGSDYVWVSRMFHPAVGFAWSSLYMFAVFLIGFVGTIMVFGYTLSTAFTIWSMMFNVPALLELGAFLGSSIGTFCIAIIFTAVFALLSIVGARLIKGVLYLSWGAAIIGIILMWWILGTSSPALFAAKWNAVLSNYPTYEALQSAASAAGWTPPLGGLSAAIMALPLASLFLLGGNFGGNVIAGEIKDVGKTIPIALFLSLILGIAYWSISAFLTLGAVGENWMYAIAYSWEVAPSSYQLPFPPSQPLILSVIAYPNVALLSIVFVTYIFGSVANSFLYFWVPSRYFFAWAFDRIIPTKLADVNRKFNTPHYAIIAISVLAILSSILYLFTSWPAAWTIGTFIWEAAYIIPAIGAILLPYTKKDLLEHAPRFMRTKIAGIPLVTIVGILCTVTFVYMGYLAFTNPLITVPTVSGIGLAIAVIIVAFAIYYISVAYHKKRGLDIEMAFKELPPT